MQYSIVYSCDVERNVKLKSPPPQQSHLWACTERSGGPDGAQMDWGMDGRDWKLGRHRKYAGVLDQTQFDEFIDHVDIFAEDVETMGTLGAPGFPFGAHVPAIAFNGDDDDMIQSAYVTPMIGEQCVLVELNEWHPCLPGMEEVVDALMGAEVSRVWGDIRRQIIDDYS